MELIKAAQTALQLLTDHAEEARITGQPFEQFESTATRLRDALNRYRAALPAGVCMICQREKNCRCEWASL